MFLRFPLCWPPLRRLRLALAACLALALLLAALPAPATGPYHGNTNSHKFHAPSCRYYNCPHCTRIFYSREEAIAAGYVPCRVCNP